MTVLDIKDRERRSRRLLQFQSFLALESPLPSQPLPLAGHWAVTVTQTRMTMVTMDQLRVALTLDQLKVAVS